MYRNLPIRFAHAQTWIPFEMVDLAASHEIRCGVAHSTEQIARGSFCLTSISGNISPFRILLLWADAVEKVEN